MSNKVSLERVKQIVAEEIQSLISEDVSTEHESIAQIVANASKFLKALQTFKKGANAKVTNAVTPDIIRLEKTLLNIIENGKQYVTSKKAQKVVYKASKQPDNLI
jgi:hypothetical protein